MLYTLIVASLISVALSHNWVNSISRSVGANTQSPAAPADSKEPHAQVNPGGDIQVEFVQGHGSDVWWTLVAEKDYKMLNRHRDSKLLDRYLNEGAATKTVPAKYNKFVRTASASRTYGATPQNNYLPREVKPGSPMFIPRDPLFTGKFEGAPRNSGSRIKPEDVHQFEFPTSCTRDDRRTYHKSREYPWIIGMYRYRICVHAPRNPAVALLTMPSDAKPGRYFWHYRWRGYYDIVDVEVVPAALKVTNPYGLAFPAGTPVPPPTYQRIDHCQYVEPKSTLNCIKLTGTSYKQCLDQCNAQTIGKCSGINIQPSRNPDSVYSAFRDEVLVPFGTGCAKGTFEAPAGDSKTKVCYGLVEREPTDEEASTLVDEDPDSPVFYSTCLKRVPPVLRDTKPPAPTYTPPQFLFGQKCISCQAAMDNQKEGVAPHWEPTDENCANCDAIAGVVRPSPSPTTKPAGTTAATAGVKSLHVINSNARTAIAQMMGQTMKMPTNNNLSFRVYLDEPPKNQVKFLINPPGNGNSITKTSTSKTTWFSHAKGFGPAPKKGKWFVRITVDNKPDYVRSITFE